MKRSILLTITSLLTIIFATFHLADDVARGMSPGGLLNLVGIGICVIWLYATLVLNERRSGYAVILIASILMVIVPVIHMRGPGMGFGTHRSGGLFFVWTIFALGVTALLSVILAARLLWNPQWGQPK